MAVQKLDGGALAPSAMDGGNMTATNTGGGALPGSTPITPLPEAPNQLDQNLPMPKLPADQVPLRPTAAKMGLEATPDRGSGGFTTGVQGGGNQGHGTAGAGSSGPDLWKPTVSSG